VTEAEEMDTSSRELIIIKTADECSPFACERRLSALLLQLFNLCVSI